MCGRDWSSDVCSSDLADRQVRSAVVMLFSEGFEDSGTDGSGFDFPQPNEGAGDLWAAWQEQLGPEQPLACRLTALEILMVQQQPIAEQRLDEQIGRAHV